MNPEVPRINDKERTELEEFRKLLEGWQTSPDGDDYCPECWQKYLVKFNDKPDVQESVKKDVIPTTTVAEFRKASDGWITACEGGCGKMVSIPSL